MTAPPRALMLISWNLQTRQDSLIGIIWDGQKDLRSLHIDDKWNSWSTLQISTIQSWQWTSEGSPTTVSFFHTGLCQKVSTFCWLGTTISQDRKREVNIDCIDKKGLQLTIRAVSQVLHSHHWVCPHHLNNNLIWCCNLDRMKHMARSPKKLIERNQHSSEDLFSFTARLQAEKVIGDPSHPKHHIFRFQQGLLNVR